MLHQQLHLHCNLQSASIVGKKIQITLEVSVRSEAVLAILPVGGVKARARTDAKEARAKARAAFLHVAALQPFH